MTDVEGDNFKDSISLFLQDLISLLPDVRQAAESQTQVNELIGLRRTAQGAIGRPRPENEVDVEDQAGQIDSLTKQIESLMGPIDLTKDRVVAFVRRLQTALDCVPLSPPELQLGCSEVERLELVYTRGRLGMSTAYSNLRTVEKRLIEMLIYLPPSPITTHVARESAEQLSEPRGAKSVVAPVELIVQLRSAMKIQNQVQSAAAHSMQMDPKTLTSLLNGKPVLQRTIDAASQYVRNSAAMRNSTSQSS